MARQFQSERRPAESAGAGQQQQQRPARHRSAEHRRKARATQDNLRVPTANPHLIALRYVTCWGLPVEIFDAYGRLLGLYRAIFSEFWPPMPPATVEAEAAGGRGIGEAAAAGMEELLSGGSLSELETMALLLIVIKCFGGLACTPTDCTATATGANEPSAAAAAAAVPGHGALPSLLRAMSDWSRRLLQYGGGVEMFARHSLLRSYRSGDVDLDRAQEPLAGGGVTDHVLERLVADAAATDNRKPSEAKAAGASAEATAGLTQLDDLRTAIRELFGQQLDLGSRTNDDDAGAAAAAAAAAAAGRLGDLPETPAGNASAGEGEGEGGGSAATDEVWGWTRPAGCVMPSAVASFFGRSDGSDDSTVPPVPVPQANAGGDSTAVPIGSLIPRSGGSTSVPIGDRTGAGEPSAGVASSGDAAGAPPPEERPETASDNVALPVFRHVSRADEGWETAGRSLRLAGGLEQLLTDVIAEELGVSASAVHWTVSTIVDLLLAAAAEGPKWVPVPVGANGSDDASAASASSPLGGNDESGTELPLPRQRLQLREGQQSMLLKRLYKLFGRKLPRELAAHTKGRNGRGKAWRSGTGRATAGASAGAGLRTTASDSSDDEAADDSGSNRGRVAQEQSGGEKAAGASAAGERGARAGPDKVTEEPSALEQRTGGGGGGGGAPPPAKRKRDRALSGAGPGQSGATKGEADANETVSMALSPPPPPPRSGGGGRRKPTAPSRWPPKEEAEAEAEEDDRAYDGEGEGEQSGGEAEGDDGSVEVVGGKRQRRREKKKKQKKKKKKRRKEKEEANDDERQHKSAEPEPPEVQNRSEQAEEEAKKKKRKRRKKKKEAEQAAQRSSDQG